MKLRLPHTGFVIVCATIVVAMVLAAQREFHGATKRLPPVDAVQLPEQAAIPPTYDAAVVLVDHQAELPSVSPPTTPAVGLRAVAERPVFRSVFDGVVTDSLFGRLPDRFLRQVDHQEFGAAADVLPFWAAQQPPQLEPPLPARTTELETVAPAAPTRSPAALPTPSSRALVDTSAEVESSVDTVSKATEAGDEFPPMTLPADLEAARNSDNRQESAAPPAGQLETWPQAMEKIPAPGPHPTLKIEQRTPLGVASPALVADDDGLAVDTPSHEGGTERAVNAPEALPWVPGQQDFDLAADPERTAAPSAKELGFAAVDREQDQLLLLQAARNAWQLDDRELALERFTEYLQRYPEDAEVRLEFSGILSSEGQAANGVRHLEHLLQQYPDNLAVLRRFADLQMQLSNFAKAEPVLDRLLQSAAHRVDAAVDLARVYANTNRRQAAVQVYEQILSGGARENTKRMKRYAQLLLDIRRPAEALELLWDLRQQEPVSLEVQQLLVLATARAGHRASTFEALERMQSLEPEDRKTRLRFAQQLFGEGHYRESRLVDQQILAFEPGNPESLIRSANASLLLYEPLLAKAALAGVRSDVTDPNFVRTQAAYHSLVGEHADAISLCRRLLAERPDDLRTRLVLGDVYLRASQLERSIDAFASVRAAALEPGVPNATALRVDATLSNARALAEAHRFDEALALLETSDFPAGASDGRLDTYLAVLSKARRYGLAVGHVRRALADALGDTGREIRLRSQLGLLLARNGQYASALQELAVAEQMADEPLPEAVYGKYQAYKMLGEHERMRSVFDEYLGPFGADAFLRVRVAELATEDCDCCLARSALEPLDSLCDANPFIANRLGAACSMCATCEAAPSCAGYFQRALVASPNNVQALLGAGRTFARTKNYSQAYCYFQKAEAYLPHDLNLKREIGRMLRDWKGPEEASRIYDQALALTSTAPLLEAAKQDPSSLPELKQEYEQRADYGAAIAGEKAGKQHAGWKPLSAVSVFEGVSWMEPHNEDAVFEIGQAFSQLERTYCAIQRYEQLLCMNPCHREAAVALDRNRREVSPQLHLFTRYRSQKGRQNLSTIDHFGVGAIMQYPLGDENEFLQIGYNRVTYAPPGATQLDGHVAMGRVQWKPVWPVLIFSEFDYEVYDYGFSPRWTFDVGSKFRYIENAEFRVHLRQENVIQNRVSIYRNVHRWGPEIGHFWQPTSRLEVDALVRYWEYSDDNASNEGGIHTGYQLTFGRDRLRWLTDFDWMAYRNETVFGDPNDLETVSHPYFAPDLFWFVSGGFEHRHYFGCDTFKAGNRRWIEGYAGGRLDSDGVGYLAFRGEFNWDYFSRLSSSGYFEYLTSDTYTNGEAGLRVTLRY